MNQSTDFTKQIVQVTGASIYKAISEATQRVTSLTESIQTLKDNIDEEHHRNLLVHTHAMDILKQELETAKYAVKELSNAQWVPMQVYLHVTNIVDNIVDTTDTHKREVGL